MSARESLLFSDAEMLSGVSAYLRTEYPHLWNLACECDHNERLGRATDQMQAEAEAVMHELWLARTAARQATDG